MFQSWFAMIWSYFSTMFFTKSLRVRQMFALWSLSATVEQWKRKSFGRSVFLQRTVASPLFSSELSVVECKLQSPVLHYYLFAYLRRRCSFLTNFHWIWRALKLYYRSRFIGQIFRQMNKRTFLPLHFPSTSVLSQTFHELITFFSYIVGKSDWNYGGRASSFELKQAAALVLSVSSLMNIALPSIISIPKYAEWKHFGRHGWRPRAEWFSFI